MRSCVKTWGKVRAAACVVQQNTCPTHPVLSGNAIEKISSSELDEMIVTDTIALSKEASSCKKIKQLSLARVLAEAIKRVSNEESISAMFR